MRLKLLALALGAAILSCPQATPLFAQQSAADPVLWTSLPQQGSLSMQGSGLSLVSYSSPLIGCTDCAPAASNCVADCAGSCGYDPCCGSAIDHSGSWVTIDYLLWQVSGYGVPPLVTSSPVGTPREDAGVLPGATILFGNDELDNDLRSGGRLRFGYWYDDCRSYGFEGSFLALGQESSNFSAFSDGSTGSLGRPFFNSDPNVNAPDALIVGFDDPIDGDAYAGTIDVTTSSNVYSGHFAYRALLQQYGSHRVDFTLGYRFFRLDEGLQINDNITVDGVAGGIVGTNFQIQDQFNTSNTFHGAELGLVSTKQYGCWTSELILKLALGNNHREVTIDGQTITTIPGFPPFVADGGLLALPTNSGAYRDDRFVAIPELNANFSYQVNPCWKLTLGYSLIYVSDVVRPGDQIDFNVNGSQLAGGLTGPADPGFNLQSDSLWVYGVNIGAQYNY